MLEALGRRKAPHDRLAGRDLVEILSHLAQALRREVGVFLDRHGAVTHVVLSRRWQPLIAERGHRAGRGSGLRYVEAHPQPDGHPDDADRRILQALTLDLVLTTGSLRGAPTALWILAPGRGDPRDRSTATAVEIEGPYRPDDLGHLELAPRVRAAEAARRAAATVATKAGEPERAVLVGLERGDAGRSLEELARLAEAAGARPVATVVQRRGTPHPARYLGRGKVEEVLRATEAHAADVVLVDDELTPVQQRTLEQALGVKVLDRTALVLDIFAQRARSREGRLQVELAQMIYLLPRLAGRGIWLSRLGGGIGTRGPGETKLEVDRRRIRARITDLQREIDAIQRHRAQQRTPRQDADVAQVALVGYTNAGKSTLLNALTGAAVFVDDRLFATLDPTVRRLVLPNGRTVVLADTVGFIQRLPTELIAAFRGTLEEVVHADMLLHVVDASHPEWETQAGVVAEVLDDIGAGGRPLLTVFNKADLLAPAEIARLRQAHPEAVVVSAARGNGLEDLRWAIARRLPEPWVRVRVKIPYADARALARLHADGKVLTERYDEDGVAVEAEVPGPLAVQLRAPRARPGVS